MSEPEGRTRGPNGRAATRCPVCERVSPPIFFSLADVPILCNVLWPSESIAGAAPTATIELVACPACGMIHNRTFDAHRVDYALEYENALHFSGRFRRYAEEAAARLIDRHDIRGQEILEIGCGDGHFLELLCRLGGNRGTGFDPSMRSRASPPDGDTRISIVGQSFTPDHLRDSVRLICCRHVLEHIKRPREWLRSLRTAIGSASTLLYFEVPNGLWLLRELYPWDVIYEHCSYFAPVSLAGLFRRAGFEPVEIAETYDGQFLTIEAKPGPISGQLESLDPAPSGDRSLVDLSRHVVRFGAACGETVAGWQERLAAMRERGERTIVWGAGSKGVTFVNVVDRRRTVIDRVVDVNPRKHDRFVPGAGQRVVPPEDLTNDPPGTVIVMNPIYAEEIARTLDGLGLSPEIVAA